MRTFIAIPMPKAILHQLVRLTAPLQSKFKNGLRWVSPDNMHLTLRFLGESSPEQVETLQKHLQQLCEIPTFFLSFAEYGVFPAWKAPNTIWLGFEKNSDLENLQRTVESIVCECGYTPEKRSFHPHLTIARVNRNPSSVLVEHIKHTFKEEASQPQIAPFQACHVVLFQSILSPEGAQYKALQKIELARH